MPDEISSTSANAIMRLAADATTGVIKMSPSATPRGVSTRVCRSACEPCDVRHNDPLEGKLAELHEATDPHLRGRVFEQLVAEIFARAGFDVVPNAGAAHPRQTDLYASDQRDSYLHRGEVEERSNRIAGRR